MAVAAGGAGGASAGEGAAGSGENDDGHDGLLVRDLSTHTHASEAHTERFLQLCLNVTAVAGQGGGGAVCVVCDVAEERGVTVTKYGRVVGRVNIAAQSRTAAGVWLAAEEERGGGRGTGGSRSGGLGAAGGGGGGSGWDGGERGGSEIGGGSRLKNTLFVGLYM
jgi:hypothetical protein